MSDIGILTGPSLLEFAAGFVWAAAAICWLIVLLGRRTPEFQARWNAIAAAFAALASGLLAIAWISS